MYVVHPPSDDMNKQPQLSDPWLSLHPCFFYIVSMQEYNIIYIYYCICEFMLTYAYVFFSFSFLFGSYWSSRYDVCFSYHTYPPGVCKCIAFIYLVHTLSLTVNVKAHTNACLLFPYWSIFVFFHIYNLNCRQEFHI